MEVRALPGSEENLSLEPCEFSAPWCFRMSLTRDTIYRLLETCTREKSVPSCRIEDPTVFTWHAIMTAHVLHKEYEVALSLYHRMLHHGTEPDKYVFTCLLRACASMCGVEQGKIIHDQLIRHQNPI